MDTIEPTCEELRAELVRLRERLRRTDEAARGARRRERAYAQLLAATATCNFTFRLDADDTLHLDRHEGADDGSENPLPSHASVRALARRVAHERAPRQDTVTVDEDGGRPWRVTVVPVATETDGTCRLVGAGVPLTADEEEARRAEQETRLRYRRLLRLLPDAVAIVDDGGTVLYLNEAGRRLVGVHGENAAKRTSLWDLVHRHDADEMRHWMHRLRRDDRVDPVEVTLVRRDGVAVEVEAAAVSIVFDGRPAVLITAHDLSGRRAIERALTETQELFYNAFHLGPAALGIIALESGTLVDANAQFQHVSGYIREDLLYASVEALGLWADPEDFRALRRGVERQGRVEPYETTLCRADGSRRTVLLAAQRIEVHGEDCMLLCAVDVSERKHALTAERESRSLLAKIFNVSAAPITISAVDDGSFIDVNDAYAELTGYSRRELLDGGTDALDVWIDAERRRELVARLRAEGHVTEEELRLRRRDGEERVLVCSLQHITVQGREAVLAILNDITHRQQAAEALERAKRHAEEMEQVKTTLLTNLTHEVRTPLTVILGFSSVLREGVREEYERFVTLIERSGRRLLLMLDAMLDLAQLEAGTVDVGAEPCDASSVVREATEALRPMIEQKGLDLQVDLPLDYEAMVRFDADILKRVLVNLLDNAVKFTEEGEVGVSFREEPDFLAIDVRDTGIGIEKAYVPHAFDPFSQEDATLERGHQGSGLGLTVSQRLVELGGGTIRVDTEKGRGSVFTIRLPRAAD